MSDDEGQTTTPDNAEPAVQAHHTPATQSLDLATHPAVSDAWQEFFRLCREYAARIRQRKAADQDARQDTKQDGANSKSGNAENCQQRPMETSP